ncbi:Oxidoreductase FAD/NAD(P)-binding protein [Ophiocordyceps sinensis CO18]|uniref:Oxidoreductase FAD/NAD(P)-binding protein n=1 Tax=Ophiocordyceps sinensis (strain Co18 / CGMCC 3.14243) TaxID=911162 RepID=T5AG61_OPHSC|nr:Oxidoreductase FAD/NAD(P)-binding protein [Ophiocordyceps sinensis CO18]
MYEYSYFVLYPRSFVTWQTLNKYYLDEAKRRKQTLYPDGKSSTHLHSLAPGQSLFFVACLKGYQWKPNVFPHVALIAGGAGITPIFQLAQGILGNPDDRTAVTLVFGVNSDRDVLFKDEFDDYERRFPGRFRAVYVVSDPATASPHRKGRVTRELLSDILPSEARHDTTNVFVCGPPAMEKSLVGDGGVLQGLGFRKHQIHTF